MDKTIGFDGTYAQDCKKAKSFSRAFDTLVDYDDESYYISKKTFRHTEDDGSMDFEYNYVVHSMDLYEISGADEHKGKFSVELFMVPKTEFLSEKALADVASCNGIEPKEVTAMDVVSYGNAVRMGMETVDGVYSWNSKKLKNAYNGIATVYEVIDSMRGFYLDGAWNGLGTTGWDSLHELLDGTDAIRTSMNRWRENA